MSLGLQDPDQMAMKSNLSSDINFLTNIDFSQIDEMDPNLFNGQKVSSCLVTIFLSLYIRSYLTKKLNLKWSLLKITVTLIFEFNYNDWLEKASD